MIIITGTVGVAAVLVSVAALSFGAVATLATPRPVIQEGPAVPLPGMTPDASPSTPAPTPASSAAPTPAGPKMVMGEDGMMPYFDATDDISTIPIPASFSPDEAANGKVWLQHAALDAKCMADKGFRFTYTPYWLRPPRPPGASSSPCPCRKTRASARHSGKPSGGRQTNPSATTTTGAKPAATATASTSPAWTTQTDASIRRRLVVAGMRCRFEPRRGSRR